MRTGIWGAIRGRGNTNRVVYVIDRSGSMAPTFDEVRVELLKSISRLKPEQHFHIILFANNKYIEGPKRKLLAATVDNKLAAKRFLGRITASGRTTVLPGLKRAFAILGGVRGRTRGGAIYLLSDGLFADVTGGSPYRTKDRKTLRGSEAVIQFLRDHNPKGENQVHVNTMLYLSKDDSAVKVMKKDRQGQRRPFQADPLGGVGCFTPERSRQGQVTPFSAPGRWRTRRQVETVPRTSASSVEPRHPAAPPEWESGASWVYPHRAISRQ